MVIVFQLFTNIKFSQSTSVPRFRLGSLGEAGAGFSGEFGVSGGFAYQRYASQPDDATVHIITKIHMLLYYFIKQVLHRRLYSLQFLLFFSKRGGVLDLKRIKVPQIKEKQ